MAIVKSEGNEGMTGWATQKMVINNEFCCCSHEYWMLKHFCAWRWHNGLEKYFCFNRQWFSTHFPICASMFWCCAKMSFYAIKITFIVFLQLHWRMVEIVSTSRCFRRFLVTGETFYVAFYCFDLQCYSERVTFNSISLQIRANVAKILLWR